MWVSFSLDVTSTDLSVVQVQPQPRRRRLVSNSGWRWDGRGLTGAFVLSLPSLYIYWPFSDAFNLAHRRLKRWNCLQITTTAISDCVAFGLGLGWSGSGSYRCVCLTFSFTFSLLTFLRRVQPGSPWLEFARRGYLRIVRYVPFNSVCEPFMLIDSTVFRSEYVLGLARSCPRSQEWLVATLRVRSIQVLSDYRSIDLHYLL